MVRAGKGGRRFRCALEPLTSPRLDELGYPQALLAPRLRLILQLGKQCSHAPDLYATLQHLLPQFVVGPQVAITGDNCVGVAAEGCCQDWMVFRVTSAGWNGGGFDPQPSPAQPLY